MSNEEQTFTLQPSWKQFFVSYTLSILTIPLAGIGLIALYFVRKKHKSTRYIVTNIRITAINQKYEHNVDLIDIRKIDVQQSWLQEQLGIGTLVLRTSASKMKVTGLTNFRRLKDILEEAIESEKQRQQQKQKTKAKEPEYDPGNMEKINYLTGLWQQGLISDEDYEKERKQIE